MSVTITISITISINRSCSDDFILPMIMNSNTVLLIGYVFCSIMNEARDGQYSSRFLCFFLFLMLVFSKYSDG